MTSEVLRVGIAGVGSRGMSSFIPIVSTYDGATVAAVSDIDESALREVRSEFGIDETYRDYETMLNDCDLDAVCICTPLHLHARQTIAALERDIHVLCEVPAVISIEEAEELVRTVESSAAEYMMLENYNYNRKNELVRGLVEAGLFGEIYYAESATCTTLVGPRGVHSHETWRREWIVGRAGITYPTHMLGPILKLFGDDRINRVTCEGSGHHYEDGAGEQYKQDDSTVMLAKTEQGRLVSVRQDYLSHRPNERRYHLQGTAGSADWGDGRDRVWLDDRSEDMETWQSLSKLEDEFLPNYWTDPPEGLRGDDFHVLTAFLDAVTDGGTPPVDVHTALDMTLPGVVSEHSIAADGEWRPVPDSREW